MVLAVAQTLLVMLVSFFTYYANKSDLLAPACIACFASLMCSAASIYDCWVWNYTLGIAEVAYFTVGLLCFVIPASAVNSNRDEGHEGMMPSIVIPRALTIIVIVFGVVSSFLYVRAILQIAGGVGDWSQTMQAYRNNVAYGDADDQIPSSVSRLFKLFMAFAYVYLFVFMNDLAGTGKPRLFYLVPGIMYCVVSLVQASRGQIIAFMFAGVLMYWVLRKRYTGRTAKVPFSRVVLVILAVVAGLALFAMANTLVGRTTAKTPLDSVMTYVGGSVVGLDMYLANPGAATSPSYIFGAETFRGLYSFIGRTFNIPEYNYTFQLEYRFAGRINVGNLYTAYRYYLHDFGIAGMVILTATQGFFFGAFYRHLAQGHSKGTVWLIWETITFSYLALSVAYLPIADYLFHQYLNPTTMVTLFMFLISSFVVCKCSANPSRMGNPEGSSRTRGRRSIGRSMSAEEITR